MIVEKNDLFEKNKKKQLDERIKYWTDTLLLQCLHKLKLTERVIIIERRLNLEKADRRAEDSLALENCFL